MTDSILLYLEPDDEITTVVRRVRDAVPGRVVLVAPGRSKATSSAVSLRLLATLAGTDHREVAVVGDALTRSLASEAGLSAYGSVTDARVAAPVEPAEPRRASIHVVRGDDPTTVTAADSAAALAPRSARGDETRPVPVQRAPPPEAGRPRAARRRGRALPLIPLLAVGILLGGVGVAGAVVLPAATIRIAPEVARVGPVEYRLRFDDPDLVAGTVEATQEGTATGSYQDFVPASGQVTFRNYNIVAIEVPAETQVAAGEIRFVTTTAVVVEGGSLTGAGFIAPGLNFAPILAEAAGPGGNVAAMEIDTILDEQTRNRLRGFPQNTQTLVLNEAPTAGGLESSGPVIEQADVDAAMAALREELAGRVSEELSGTDGGVFADPIEPPQPVIEVPDGLVGTRDEASFTLTGTLAYDRATLAEDEIEATAREQLLDDASAVPANHVLLLASIEVSIGEARRENGALEVAASVSARSARRLDADGIGERVAGMPIEAARAELADLGQVRIDTWPGWVSELPTLGWRLEVRIDDPAADDPSVSPSP
ncbi:MAG: hypothetical protein ACRDGV_03695 [Candidatus Limnocylindria bacterium]